MKKFFSLIFLSFIAASTLFAAENWFICFGSFTQKRNAVNRVIELQDEDIPALIIQIEQAGTPTLYRVLSEANFSRVEEARAYKNLIEKIDITGRLNLKGIWCVGYCTPDPEETAAETETPVAKEESPAPVIEPAPASESVIEPATEPVETPDEFETEIEAEETEPETVTEEPVEIQIEEEAETEETEPETVTEEPVEIQIEEETETEEAEEEPVIISPIEISENIIAAPENQEEENSTAEEEPVEEEPEIEVLNEYDSSLLPADSNEEDVASCEPEVSSDNAEKEVPFVPNPERKFIIVKDSDTGNPIPLALVNIDERWDIMSDNDGKAPLPEDIEDGVHSITVSKDGQYVSTATQITVKKQEIITAPQVSIPKMVDYERIKIILDWGEYPYDLDSHIYKDYSNHVYYSNREEVNLSLDRDDTDSYGPETITIESPATEDFYQYFVKDYSNEGDYYSNKMSYSSARVKGYFQNELVKTYTIRPGVTGTCWHVFDVVNGYTILDVDTIDSSY